MSLEARVIKLEQKVEHLEYAFHESSKIMEATHGVVSLILNEQREKFKAVDQRFDKSEELLIQIVNHLAGK
ncbi:hypothetical protein [Endozoicomonas sp. 4G]|uniref:hypothetical protein n=1 Tax=Endozoicomonas sp. 4G TaxID=2872754 RepID=UPI00207911B0|nr:hypothetical protein [Endozoicomonas sp. 4G]